MKYYLTIVLFVLCVFAVSAQTKYSRISIPLSSEISIRKLASFGLDLEGAVKRGDHISIFVSDVERRMLSTKGVSYDVLIDDWDAYYAARETGLSKTAAPLLSDPAHFHLGDMGGYLTYSQIFNELAAMKTAYPQLVSGMDTIGFTLEKRPIVAVKISAHAQQDLNLPRVLFTALHHAREPEGLMTVVYFMWHLLESYSVDEEVTGLLDHRELYFVPVVNPDGYVYNEQSKPAGGGMWRKNRRPFQDATFGVDVNRNYGSHWGYDDVGSNPDSTSDTYRGPGPFSECESSAIRDYGIKKHFNIALNYHTFGNDIIYPIGYIDEESPDSTYFRMITEDMTAVNRLTFGTGMETVLYPTNGDSDDWFYCDSISKPKVFSMTPEVGDDVDGFWPGNNRILPIARANLPMNLYVAHAAGVLMTLDSLRVEPEYPVDTAAIFFTFKNKGITSFSGPVDLTLSCPDGLVQLQDSVFTGLPSTPFTIGAVCSAAARPGNRVRIVATLRYADGITHDSIIFRLGPARTLFADSAETVMAAWKSVNGWGRTNVAAHTGSWSYSESPNGNYLPSISSSMTLNSQFVFKNLAAAELHFWTKWHIETNGDFGTVKVSTNNGITWSNVGGRYCQYAGGANAQKPEYAVGYQGVRKRWVHEVIDLTPFAKQNFLMFRFGFESDTYTNYDGWYIDDIRLLAFDTKVVDVAPQDAPHGFGLEQNVPNPFVSGTDIRYSVAEKSYVIISVYNTLGVRVATLADDVKTAGTFTEHWITEQHPGVYVCRMVAVATDNPGRIFTKTRKMIVVK